MEKSVLGDFQSELQDLILKCIQTASDTSKTWFNLQGSIASQFRSQFGNGNVQENVPLDKLGVPGVKAEMDIVCSADLTDQKLGGFLIHVSGHKLPRHEKEVLEFMAVSLSDPRFRLAVLVVCSDNALRLEGKRSSFDYCGGFLKRLVTPILKHSNLRGLLIVGLPTNIK